MRQIAAVMLLLAITAATAHAQGEPEMIIDLEQTHAFVQSPDEWLVAVDMTVELRNLDVCYVDDFYNTISHASHWLETRYLVDLDGDGRFDEGEINPFPGGKTFDFRSWWRFGSTAFPIREGINRIRVEARFDPEAMVGATAQVRTSLKLYSPWQALPGIYSNLQDANAFSGPQLVHFRTAAVDAGDREVLIGPGVTAMAIDVDSPAGMAVDLLGLTVQQTAGDWRDVGETRLVLDANNNGAVDADDILLAVGSLDAGVPVVFETAAMGGTPLRLPADMTTTLLVVIDLLATTGDGMRFGFSATDAVVEGTDAAAIASGLPVNSPVLTARLPRDPAVHTLLHHDGDREVAAGDSVIVTRIDLSGVDVNGARVAALTLSALGDLPDTWGVVRARVWHDANGNSRLDEGTDGSDRLVGTGVFLSDNGAMQIGLADGLVLANGSRVPLLLGVTFAEAAPIGSMFSVRLDSVDIDGGPAPDDLPLTGPALTIVAPGSTGANGDPETGTDGTGGGDFNNPAAATLLAASGCSAGLSARHPLLELLLVGLVVAGAVLRRR